MTTVQFQLGGTLKFITEDAAGGVFVTLRYRDFTIKAKGNDMSYTLAAGMQVSVKVSYVDANDNEAEVDGDVRWSSSDDSIVTVIVDDSDSTQATVRATGSVGQAQVTAVADADLGEGIRPLTTPMDVEVVAGEAMSGTIEPVGGAEPIPRVDHHRS